MQGLLFLPTVFLLSLVSVQAGSTNFSDLTGTYFRFVNMSETGDSVPPSQLQVPELISDSRDTIKFRPTTFIAITNGTSATIQSNSLSTQLDLQLQGLPDLALEELQISVAGSWGVSTYPVTGSFAEAGLSLQFDLIFGGVTKNFIVPITQNAGTWAGLFTVTPQILADNFVVPLGGIRDLRIITTQTVTASAAFGDASSGINYLDISAKAVPEPGSSTLFLLGAALWGLNRIRQNRKS
jgi:hypothetical protein